MKSWGPVEVVVSPPPCRLVLLGIGWRLALSRLSSGSTAVAQVVCLMRLDGKWVGGEGDGDVECVWEKSG